jgi:hypothetical protein
MFMRLALLAGRWGRTRLEIVIPLEFKMFQTLQWMTGSLRIINIMLSHLIRRICCVSSAQSVAMLEMAMVEIAMALGKATGKDLRSNHSPSPHRRWLLNLTSLACLMMMMMNPQRRSKAPPTAQMMR